ncbi:hypothetical protein SteCoe_25942 [Stentor coeruleus]|uniref:Uncharacterized protein n=1 Tax=Stentor coeruleus TaxID=5963 RepID=A0A1R2BE33_9CILI|nr:hypothetical protein SteCoe_25942 [Stentor coeruleus]
MNKITCEIEENNRDDFFDVTCTTEHGFYVLLMIGIIESWKECASCRSCSVNTANAQIVLNLAKNQSKIFGLMKYFKQFYGVFSTIFQLDIKGKIHEVSKNNSYNDLSIAMRCILSALSPRLSFSIMSGAVSYPEAMKERFLNLLSAELNVVFVIKDQMDKEKYIESCRTICPIINLIKKDNGYCLRYYKNKRHKHFNKELILKEISAYLSTGLMAN